MAQLIDILRSAAVDAVEAAGIQVVGKTNLGPEFTIYRAGDRADDNASSPFDLLKVGVEIRDAQGRVLKRIGEWPKTDYLVVAGIATASVLLVWLLVRGLRR